MARTSDLGLSRDVLGYVPKYDVAAAVGDLADWLKARKAA
jgi:nucleoside-diphosphate-sugar epimerase